MSWLTIEYDEFSKGIHHPKTFTIFLPLKIYGVVVRQVPPEIKTARDARYAELSGEDK